MSKLTERVSKILNKKNAPTNQYPNKIKSPITQQLSSLYGEYVDSKDLDSSGLDDVVKFISHKEPTTMTSKPFDDLFY